MPDDREHPPYVHEDLREVATRLRDSLTIGDRMSLDAARVLLDYDARIRQYESAQIIRRAERSPD